MLDAAAQFRGISALRCFNERIRDYPPDAVRAVATNTLRVAKNAPHFLVQAEAALGFPIEVIAGREEARLIYVGVAHTLPNPHKQQLVVDIGGGSTEFVIGKSFKPIALESLYMGCVSYSLQALSPTARIDKRGLREAELAAPEGDPDHHPMPTARSAGRRRSARAGSAKALVDILELNGLSDGGITRSGPGAPAQPDAEGPARWTTLQLEGLRPDRLPVPARGLCDHVGGVPGARPRAHGLLGRGALRLGVLYDLLGPLSPSRPARRHGVGLRRALRGRPGPRAGGGRHGAGLPAADRPGGGRRGEHRPALPRSGRRVLHEAGVSVAHSSYHKHSAYILGNADMPGFSRMDQGRLARIVLAHRGKLARVVGLDPESAEWRLILCLRLAVVVQSGAGRPGRAAAAPEARRGAGYVAIADSEWLRNLPLTASALEEEERQWQAICQPLKLRVERAPARSAAGIQGA